MNEHALLPEPRRVTGLTPKQERTFHWIAISVIGLMTTAWALSIAETQHQRRQTPVLTPGPPVVSRSVTSAILDPRTKPMPFITEAALQWLDPLRGYSGELAVAFRLPGEQLAETDEPLGASYRDEAGRPLTTPGLTTPADPGVYEFAVELNRARKAIDDFKIITLVPFEEKEDGRIGLYYLGVWPYERGGKPRSKAYANPSGFIKVTAENRETPVSEHFRLRDFLTKDQPNVWPKYLLLDPRLLDKLELTIQELEAQGIDVKHVHVMSGFRTPRYNHSGGNTGGRANLSRHMYGDASDIFIDNDRNGTMDDLNGDGRVTMRDAEILANAAERVERKLPALVGGIAPYQACCGHGPFVHVDVRGYRARWRGSGNG